MGKLIVFEGIDGSGKSTQFQLLCKRLEEEKIPFQKLVFPQYAEPSSALIRMYLGGEFGSRPEDVNPYAASAFYAVDRFASYVKVWRDYYNAGGILLADRYTTSNAIHQGSKLPRSERCGFFNWLYEFEYDRMGLPQPDLVLYMDVPLEIAAGQMRSREKATNTNADIHEADLKYLKKCCEAGNDAAVYYSWHKVVCAHAGKMRSVQEIQDEVYALCKEKIVF